MCMAEGRNPGYPRVSSIYIQVSKSVKTIFVEIMSEMEKIVVVELFFYDLFCSRNIMPQEALHDYYETIP